MIISQLNSIRFRKVDSNYQNFDNTLLADEKFYNDNIFTYCQRFPNTLTQTIQVKSNSNTVPTVTAYKADNTTETITAAQASVYDQDGDGTNDLYYFEFDVDFSLFTTETYITVVQDTETWKSEPFIGDSDVITDLQNGDLIKIEYYNDDNAFSIDFSTDITFELYVEAIAKDYNAGGETSIYDNQDEITKLKETAMRMLVFNTRQIPRYLAETIRLASACDNFVVNGVSFVREDLPEISVVEGSNFVTLSMTLNDKEYLGVNTHDIGFNCDTTSTEAEVMINSEVDASGSVSFSVPAGYLVHTLTGTWTSGTTVEVKLGTTVGGQDLAFPFNLTASLTKITSQVHSNVDRANASTIYATVTGGVATLDLQLIQNKES